MGVSFRSQYFLFIVVLQFSYIHSTQLIQLDENDWDRMLTGEWMVEFFAPWCPACKALQSTWEEFSSWSKDLDLSIAQVDVTKSPGLSGRFMVTALPTIFHVYQGEFRVYKGSRDKDSIITFIEEKKWKQIEAVPSWKSPSSVQMSIVSHFFKLSQFLRTIHNKLMDEYGLPSWGSYVIFALVTIFVGAFLGLIMVCLIDYFYPPKMPAYKNVDSKKNDAGSELVEDEILDDADDMKEVDEPDDEDADQRPAAVEVRKRKVPKAN